MRNKMLVALFVTAGLVVVSSRLLAHHSAAGLFSLDEEIILSGTVTAWRLVNPHPALMFDVRNDAGTVESWTATFNSLRDLRKIGWTKSTFKPGDQVTVLGNPFFSGKKTIFPLVVTTPDGKKHQLREPRVNKEYAESE
ncbi:MAG: DUF6152 family protein [Acidobacteria bacterium]|nr:DUF6152 family protein [Acidobacteriota bacterium]